MIVTLENGFSCDVNLNGINNMRVVEAMAKIDSSKTDFEKLDRAMTIIVGIMGEEGKEALYRFHEEREGVCTPEAFMEDLSAIIIAAKEEPEAKK